MPGALLLGGTGYLGKAFAVALARAGWSVNVLSRGDAASCQAVRETIAAACGKESGVRVAVTSVPLPTALRGVVASFTDPMITPIAVVNLGLTERRQRGREELFHWIDALLGLVESVRRGYDQVVFVNIGSITEYSRWVPESAYTSARKVLRQRVFASGLCDFHLVFGLVYPDNPRMERDMRRFLPLLRASASVLDSVRLSCIRLDLLIERLVALLSLTVTQSMPQRESECTMEVRVLDEELTVGELISRVLPQEWERLVPIGRQNAVWNCVAPRLCCALLRVLGVWNDGSLRLSRFYQIALREDGDTLNHYLALGRVEEIRRAPSEGIILASEEGRVGRLIPSQASWYIL